MLEFLVTSKVRRHLLAVLWGEDAVGSTAHLAHLAGVGFAGAYRELRAMEAAGLVVTQREGAAQVYRANRAHPQAEALVALVTKAAREVPEVEDAQRVRSHLAALGAPVRHAADLELSEALDPDATVVRGVHAAHRDPDVARSLPVCLFRQRDALDPLKLRDHAKQLGEKHALGFFLDLTAELSGDRRFSVWARSLRDRRRKVGRAFFAHSAVSRSLRERRLTKAMTPRLAERWGWTMNMDLDTFRSTFDKFVPNSQAMSG